ncbi:MAG: protease complex subunit PrcB family protein [Elusimicrobia bacterium]|nr:protease complex subunit PrcB family protein [Elusimicrobiota bacterium]
MNKSLAALSAALFFSACAGKPVGAPPANDRAPAAAGEDASTPVKEAAMLEWKGQFSSAEQPDARALKTAADWAAAWAAIGTAAPEAPDFQGFFGAAVFLGQRSTGGFGVRWLEPRRRDGKLEIFYQETKPTGLTMQVITQPYAVKLFPRGGAADASVTRADP